MKEMDHFYIHLISIITQLLGFTKKVHGKMSVAQQCKKYLDTKPTSEFYLYLFKTYTRKYNWGYPDLHPEAWIVQGGFGFSIFLIQKYGAKPREIKFYSDKYLRAFPTALRDFPGSEHSTDEEDFQRCYALRVFERFLKRFGLIETDDKGKILSDSQIIIKKELLDQVIKWKII